MVDTEKIIRRIIKKVRGAEHMGGFMCFSKTGAGGTWYSDGSDVGSGHINIPLRMQRGKELREDVTREVNEAWGVEEWEE